MHITREEVLKLAQLSMLEFSDSELEQMAHDLVSLVKYIDEIKNVEIDQIFDTTRLVNVFREDKVAIKDRQAILNQAPERFEDYIVVPKIVETE